MLISWVHVWATHPASPRTGRHGMATDGSLMMLTSSWLLTRRRVGASTCAWYPVVPSRAARLSM